MAKEKKATPKGKKKKKEKRIPHHRQPEDLSLRQWQIGLRRQFGIEQTFELKNEGDHPVWSDFLVRNPDSKTAYRLALRGKEVGDNFCSCPDFRASGLGTCKHIEWALHKLQNTYGLKQYFRKPPPERPYSSVYLHYGDTRTVRLRIGSEQEEALTALANNFFDEEGVIYPNAYLEFDNFLEQATALTPSFRCYPDALDFIIQQRADERRRRDAQALAERPDSLEGLLKTALFPYQREGVLFAFQAGRALIADEMGLGKTLQAIAAAELYRREYGIESVLIICPTSLKYQWRSEIRKFTDSSVKVIEGPATAREEAYLNDKSFYKIITYNVVARDYERINRAAPDLIVLDEAQRIKNWDTKISRGVKRLWSPYRLALTGTPLENKLEDLYSIVQFLDQYRLGPLYLLQSRHQVKDETGRVVAYRGLDEIYQKLQAVMIRRRKRQVLRQLPERMDQNLFVPMTTAQQSLYAEYEEMVGKLVAKWRRLGFLQEKDRQMLLKGLNLMRMSCDSTYLIDQRTRNDTKIAELFYILEEYLTDPEEKVVIFSQWERMTRIVAEELDERGIAYAYLHGGVPSIDRGDLLDRFRDDADCRVFLSTDAGGLGLNLQVASLVVNLDIPWNPAVLEQRIGRVYRMGQGRPVQVINLISTGTIEHRMLDTLAFKSSLAEAVLDTAESSVFLNDRRFKAFMEDLERVTATPTPEEETTEATAVSDDEESAPTPAADAAVTEEVPDFAEDEETPVAVEAAEEAPAPRPAADREREAAPTPRRANGGGGGAQDLLAQGFDFLGRLAHTLRDEQATQQLVNELVEQDERTGRTYVKIPVESSEVVKDVVSMLGGLLSKLR